MDPIPRSPELMSRRDSALLVVDVQDKLIGMIPQHERIVWNIGRLVDGAKILGVEVGATEQYPKGLGPTTRSLADRLGPVPAKTTFSCGGCPELFKNLRDQKRSKILVVGIETHVCIQQTVLDLLGDGFRVFVAADATGSRFQPDYEYALRRMESGGATITTTEAALFEWCETAGSPEFKEISSLVKQKMPDRSPEILGVRPA